MIYVHAAIFYQLEHQICKIEAAKAGVSNVIIAIPYWGSLFFWNQYPRFHCVVACTPVLIEIKKAQPVQCSMVYYAASLCASAEAKPWQKARLLRRTQWRRTGAGAALALECCGSS